MLEAAERARELAQHTILVCKNPKIFLPEYRSALTDDIISTAKGIYIGVWTANNVMVKCHDDWAERERMQKKAASDCNNLLALIGLARTLFHLRGKKVHHWSQMTVDVRAMIRKWHEADQRRYKDI